MSNEYFRIHPSASNDPHLSGLENLLALTDLQLFAKDGARRVPAEVSMYNYNLVMYIPDEQISRIVPGPKLTKAIKDGTLKLCLLVGHESDANNPFTSIGLPEDEHTRNKYGLSGLKQVNGVFIFHQPPRNLKPFNRETGLYEGELAIRN